MGYTPDIKNRFSLHQNGKVTSTRPFRPLSLRAYVAVESEAKAIELEKYFKSGSGKAIAIKRFF